MKRPKPPTIRHRTIVERIWRDRLGCSKTFKKFKIAITLLIDQSEELHLTKDDEVPIISTVKLRLDLDCPNTDSQTLNKILMYAKQLNC